MKKYLVLVIITMSSLSTYAQSDRQYIRKGNRFFRKQDFPKAEAEYRKALDMNARNVQAMYNLGCAMAAQQKDSAAVVQYENAGKLETSKLRKARIYHNLGTICQKHQMFSEAIEAYKESLRNNPADNETRYNLALCKRQEKKDSQNQSGKDDKNENKDQNGKNQNRQEKDKQQQNNQQNKQQEKMSKENAEQLLNAAMQEEKATQQRLNKAMQQPRSRQLQKNW
ncbi:MAG: tetratricopeptide repeat protein [Prevotella sp.]